MVNCYDYENIPKLLMEGLTRYVEDRVPTGSFLRAVLENDLHQACMTGTAASLIHMPALSRFIYNETPEECWGSKEKVEAWLKNEKDAAAPLHA